jgi:hypothetical protein
VSHTRSVLSAPREPTRFLSLLKQTLLTSSVCTVVTAVGACVAQAAYPCRSSSPNNAESGSLKPLNTVPPSSVSASVSTTAAGSGAV